MKASIAKYLNNAHAGFTLVFDDGCYYDSTLKTVEIFKEIEKQSGVKIKATSAQTVGFLNEKLIALWKELVAQGYYDIASHSMDHCICFNEQTPWDVRVNDAIQSKGELEKIYGIAPICYVAPNGGHTPEGCRALHDIYYANRNNKEGGSDPDTMDMYDIGVIIGRHEHKDPTPYIEFVDGLVKGGEYAIQVNHWLSEKEEDIFHAQRLDTFREECYYLASLALEGKLWIASMNDAVKYFYERKSAKISTQGNKITVSHTLDKSIFNMPLTLVIDTDEDKTIEINGTPFDIKAGKENIITIEV
ncbi:MAG: polysaccharide deacetylase family protein [Clostridia bacterium]|nr:polysaccharide deacetylase family protein [Clostridia bacterium]